MLSPWHLPHFRSFSYIRERGRFWWDMIIVVVRRLKSFKIELQCTIYNAWKVRTDKWLIGVCKPIKRLTGFPGKDTNQPLYRFAKNTGQPFNRFAYTISLQRVALCVYLYIYIFIYFWKLNQTVLVLGFRAVKFLFFPRRDLNPHHWYTAAPFA